VHFIACQEFFRVSRNRVLHISFSISATFVLLTTAASFCLGSPGADELLKRKGFVWKSTVTQHFRLHFEPETLAETRIEDLKRWQVQAFAKNLQLLKAAEYSFQTDIFIVSSRERMKRLTGDETNGVAFPSTKVICFVFNEKINASGSHELMHVMARNVWDGKPKAWIGEGIAVYADDIWGGYQLHDLNKHLLLEKKLVPLEKLIEDFGDYSDLITYPQAGSFVKYLYEQYGIDKIKDVWKHGSAKDLKQVLGKDVQTLEKEWHGSLMKADATKVKYRVSPER